MNHTICVEKEFTLITRDGKLTWVEKGKENMHTIRETILDETKLYEQHGSPLPDFSQACWIPFFKSFVNLGYALVDTKTSRVVAKLSYRDGFYEGNIVHPGSRYMGDFVDVHKAKMFIEEHMYGSLIAEFDLYLIEEWVSPV